VLQFCVCISTGKGTASRKMADGLFLRVDFAVLLRRFAAAADIDRVARLKTEIFAELDMQIIAAFDGDH